VPPGRWPAATSGVDGLDAGDAVDTGDTLPALWARHWALRPHDVVLVDGRDHARVADGARLLEVTRRVGAALAQEGVQPGDRVLWSATANLASIEALLGILCAGAVLVPVNPSSTASEVAHVVADATPVAAVLDDPTRAEQRVGYAVHSVDGLLALAARHPLAAASVPPAPRPGDDALIVYTSGTTGAPKGAVHTHRSLLAGPRSLRAAWGWRREDRLILALPLFHVHGLCAGLFGTLAVGASAVVFGRFDEGAVLDAAAGCTLFFGVPTMYHRLAESGRAAALAPLRLCVSGSAPLPADLWARLAAEGVEVLERYGMSETLLTLSNPLVGQRRPGSVGVPLPEVEAAIESPDEHGVGELLVRGPSMLRGYWGRDASATDDDGWFATGDLASVAADGYVSIRGRRTELIITGGHNVYPAEVEAVLSRHPGVSEVAVVGVASTEWGETVVAYVVGEADPAELTSLAEAELAPYKRPRELRVVDSLPRNAMGKVVRKALREGP
jgi:malonyl-CoA/methylmalonyl-CoA synthetase